MMKIHVLAWSLCLLLWLPAAGKNHVLFSPDKSIKIDIEASESLSYCVSVDGKTVLNPSRVSMTLADGTVYGGKAAKAKALTRSVDEEIATVVYHKASVKDKFNELVLRSAQYDVVWRAYDDGVAYRIVSRSQKPFTVQSEQVEFNFAADWTATVPYAAKRSYPNQFSTSFENIYTVFSLSGWEKGRLAFLPLMVEAGEVKVLVMESDLLHYPGLYLSNNDGDGCLESVFASFPDKVVPGGHKNLQDMVQSVHPFIAQAGPGEAFPWRILAIARQDKELADCDMVYRLAKPQDKRDWSWVKPGKVAWDWWCDWNLFGVDFKAGINTRTYEYYIDFAQRYGLEYILMDEGWSVPGQEDMMQVVSSVDLPYLCRYAEERGVGILLWGGFRAFNKDIEGLCRHYSEMGVKGFKVDFLNRDDQAMVDFCTRTAEIAAKYHLVIDFHGIYKPAGLPRTWPNVLNFEGVYGLEQLKGHSWTEMPVYDTQIPFLRNASGPMDYTPGAMRNATKKNFRPVSNEPLSQGTRTHQLAEYVVFDAPLVMLCDSPSLYEAEPDYTHLLTSIPTVWEETKVLDGKVGEYIVTARRNGKDWYIGALTNWDPRDLEIALDFLDGGDWTLELCEDGVNADKVARDHAFRHFNVKAGDSLPFHMAPGGGWFAHLHPSH